MKQSESEHDRIGRLAKKLQSLPLHELDKVFELTDFRVFKTKEATSPGEDDLKAVTREVFKNLHNKDVEVARNIVRSLIFESAPGRFEQALAAILKSSKPKVRH